VKRTRCLVVLSVIAAVSLGGCGYPPGFIKRSASEPVWSNIEIRDDMTYERAWQEAVDVVAKKFELEVISKEGGYVRTPWIYTWWKEGKITENYRVRAMLKFSPDQRKVGIKTDANYLSHDGWIEGFDTLLLETLKTDLMGTVGRTTR
jgi:hypothetical protein